MVNATALYGGERVRQPPYNTYRSTPSDDIWSDENPAVPAAAAFPSGGVSTMDEDSMDIYIDDGFDVRLDEGNDLDSVDGREEFEQRLRISLYRRFLGEIGVDAGSTDLISSALRAEAERVASEFDQLDRVSDIAVEFENPGEATVRIIYRTSDDIEFTFTT